MLKLVVFAVLFVAVIGQKPPSGPPPPPGGPPEAPKNRIARQAPDMSSMPIPRMDGPPGGGPQGMPGANPAEWMQKGQDMMKNVASTMMGGAGRRLV